MMLDRYQRHSLIDWFSQDDVKASSFAVIGCGAVGNEVAKNLALLGVGKIDLYDFDRIEIHNLTRSVLFRETDIGKFKAEVAGERVREIDSSIEVSTYVGDFWDAMSFEKAKSYDCILCCVDNFEARIRINVLSIITTTNLINTGIDSKFSQIEVFPYKSNRNIACYECNLPSSAYERMQKRYSCGWLKKISFIEKKIPTTIVTSSLAGSLAVANALNLINSKEKQSARRILIDTFTGKSTVSQIQKSDTCPACSIYSGTVNLTKASSRILNSLQFHKNDDIHIITSDPILVSYRCVNCTSSLDNSTIIFQRASSFDSSIARCDTCGEDSVDIIIKDIFSINELVNCFLNKDIPAKFIRYDSGRSTTIIELE